MLYSMHQGKMPETLTIVNPDNYNRMHSYHADGTFRCVDSRKVIGLSIGEVDRSDNVIHRHHLLGKQIGDTNEYVLLTIVADTVDNISNYHLSNGDKVIGSELLVVGIMTGSDDYLLYNAHQ